MSYQVWKFPLADEVVLMVIPPSPKIPVAIWNDKSFETRGILKCNHPFVLFFSPLNLEKFETYAKKRGGIHLLSTWVTKKLMGLTYVHTNLSLPEKMAGPKRFQDRLPTYQLSGAFSVSFREDFPENVFYLRLFAVYAYAATHKLS